MGESRGEAARGGMALAIALALFLLSHWPGAVRASGAASAPDDQGAGGARGKSATGEELTTVVVTGSYIRRTDTETPSPLQVISTAVAVNCLPSDAD